MHTADKAWLTMAAGIIAYEIAAPPGELLSEGVDRYLTRTPWLARGAVAITALHLINLMPRWADPWAIIGMMRR